MRDAIALEGPFDDVENAIIASRQRKEVDIKMRRIHPKFTRAALKGDWDIAKNYISATISNEGDTALHIAAALPHSMLGIKLVEEMHTEDLVTRNNAGNTALFPAAASGNLKLAKKMLEKNGNLALIRGGKNELPIYMAALNGHREMIRYLYEATRDHLNSEDLIELLIALIKISLFDIAQDLVKEHPEIATLHDKNEETALHCLARMPLIIDKQGTSGILYFTTGCYTRMKMPPEALKLCEILWEQVRLLDDSEILEIIRKPWSLIFAAVKQGNIEFLNIIIRECTDLIFEVDENNYSIFHYAVLYRHVEIFKLMHEIGSLKDMLIQDADEEGNTILHLAARLPPIDRLRIAAGPGSYMQTELLWFEAVKKKLHPTVAEAKNHDGKTAGKIFTEQHKKLNRKEEKWTKQCMKSFLVAATIIGTMTFAAAFTVPGGTKQDEGTPILLQNSCFVVFALFDALSLVLSTVSTMIFILLYFNRFEEEDFISWVPFRFAFGASMLFYSGIALLVAFTAALFILFKDGTSSIPLLVGFFASIFAFPFIVAQLAVTYDFIFRASYLFRSHEGTLLRIPKRHWKKTELEN